MALINAVQVQCYEDTRIMKAFPQIIKVLYNTDCVSDQAIIYWYQKGSKPQGRQHFLKITESLVKVRICCIRKVLLSFMRGVNYRPQFLQEQDSEEEE